MHIFAKNGEFTLEPLWTYLPVQIPQLFTANATKPRFQVTVLTFNLASKFARSKCNRVSMGGVHRGSGLAVACRDSVGVTCGV